MTRRNKRMLSKTLALFLAMLLSVGNMSVTAFAAETGESGGSGDMAITEIADITDAVFGEDDTADNDDPTGAEVDTSAATDDESDDAVDEGAEADPPPVGWPDNRNPDRDGNLG